MPDLSIGVCIKRASLHFNSNLVRNYLKIRTPNKDAEEEQQTTANKFEIELDKINVFGIDRR
jgi:hypothetical protein